MSMKNNTKHAQYTFPNKIPLLIDEKLGMAEGFIDTMKKITFAENMYDLVKLLVVFERKGECKNTLTGKPIKKRVDMDLVNKIEQIMTRGGYLRRTFIIENDNKHILKEEYLYEYPEVVYTNEDIELMPSLLGLKSKDELSGNEPLKRIAVAVPEKVAYANEDPTWLTETAKLQYLKNGVYYPYFETVGDIMNSEHWTKDVPLNYLDNTFNTVWQYFYDLIIEFRADAWIMARQMENIDYSDDED